jgi:hypothetical protein
MALPKPSASKALRKSTAQDAADELSINVQMVRQDVKAGAPCTKRDGRYWFNMGEYAAWRKANGRSGKQGIHADDMNPSPTLEAARLRKENAMAARHELFVARGLGRVLPIDAVKFWEAQRTTALKNRMLSVASRVTPLLQGRDAGEQHKIIDDAIRESLAGAGADISDLQRQCAAAEEN